MEISLGGVAVDAVGAVGSMRLRATGTVQYGGRRAGRGRTKGKGGGGGDEARRGVPAAPRPSVLQWHNRCYDFCQVTMNDKAGHPGIREIICVSAAASVGGFCRFNFEFSSSTLSSPVCHTHEAKSGLGSW